ncbi:hypothetical protein SAICODRAFT_156802 [Saitoella complicata NRRL Y-17804]|uniref:uncharacterized protein n=1 Tax=Saitoella complicata (strain BCRC 22490 / CBS 7301 / JCM 7358 / NBRC 10748 / NRRL Y-17804) TaxID=698492 RepID=UPI000866F316|nr:uncharacterized protein SAICODRAFT_156802 [Saitoella complicata NRRL Y-17804]ODQ51120.1 hypothetical protein SAICODRAFT_156802 [Saitoella complicata NRRL Y-17804]
MAGGEFGWLVSDASAPRFVGDDAGHVCWARSERESLGMANPTSYLEEFMERPIGAVQRLYDGAKHVENFPQFKGMIRLLDHLIPRRSRIRSLALMILPDAATRPFCVSEPTFEAFSQLSWLPRIQSTPTTSHPLRARTTRPPDQPLHHRKAYRD